MRDALCRRFLVSSLWAAFLLIAIVCATEDERAESEVAPEVPATATEAVASDPVVELDQEFNPDDYLNGAELSELLVDLKTEKPLPPQLMDVSQELTRDDVVRFWEEYMLSTRHITVVKNSVSGTASIVRVDDFCGGVGDRNTHTTIFESEYQNWFAGNVSVWEIEVPKDTVGIEARYVDPFDFRDVSGSSGNLSEQGVEGRLIFDHSACEEVIPVAQFTATQWSLLGVDGLEPKSLPEEFEPGKPQLPAEDVLHLWREWNTGILRFDNLTGFPAYISCDGVEGVILQRYDERKNFGRVNRVTIEDAREVAPNAIFVYLDWLDTAGDDRDGPRVLVPDLSVEPYSGLIDFHAPEDCSLDMADAYVASQNVVQ